MNKYLQEELEINLLSEEEQNKETTLAILTFFYPKSKRSWIDCVNEFVTMQSEHIEYNIKMDLDFDKKPARYYIKADTLLMNADIVGLYNHLSGKKVKGFSIQFAKQVKDEFLKSVSHLKDLYEWIYNPPVIGKIGGHSIGKQLRSEFQQYYGAYAELTYLIAHGHALEFDRVNSMPLNEYLALGEYLLRKRAVEGVE